MTATLTTQPRKNLASWAAPAPAPRLVGLVEVIRLLQHARAGLDAARTAPQVPQDALMDALEDLGSVLWYLRVLVRVLAGTDEDDLVHAGGVELRREDYADLAARLGASQAFGTQDGRPLPILVTGDAGRNVLLEVTAERGQQDATWGEQNHPDGTGLDEGDVEVAEYWRLRAVGAETDPARLRAELIQVAAVACAWVEALDRRKAGQVMRCDGTAEGGAR